MRRCAICLAFTLLAVTGGCETIGQDLNYMVKTILPPSPGEAARMMQDQYDPDRRREGTVWISNAPFGGVDIYVENYRVIIELESDPTVKAAAIRALGRHGTPDDAPMIGRHLGDENEYVRWEAAKALQRLHNPAVAPALRDALRNEDERSETRVAAAIALAQYPRDSVFQSLLGALDARELSVNAAAEQSLNTLTGESFDMDRIAWTRWYMEQSPGRRFANQQEYLFPTYHRDVTLLERLAFWAPRTFEQPATPAGLRPASERTTRDFADEVQ